MANTTQQTAFTYYSQRSAFEKNVFTLPMINGTLFNSLTNGTDNNPILRFCSAFSPPVLAVSAEEAQTLNNWAVELGPDAYLHGMINENLMDLWANELWIQLFDQNIVCVLTNAQFDVSVRFEQGAQSVRVNEIKNIGPFYYNFTSDVYTTLHDSAYQNIFKAFTSMINGNVTMNVDSIIAEDTSQILTTNLLSCPELNLTKFQQDSDAALPWLFIKDELQFQKFANFSLAFPSEPSDCRNGSLARALEDLANNVTLSMLSFSSVTYVLCSPSLPPPKRKKLFHLALTLVLTPHTERTPVASSPS
jgi:hypothetical protein